MRNEVPKWKQGKGNNESIKLNCIFFASKLQTFLGRYYFSNEASKTESLNQVQGLARTHCFSSSLLTNFFFLQVVGRYSHCSINRKS